MQPTLAKRTAASQGQVASPLKEQVTTLPVERMQAEAEAALRRMQAEAARKGPEVIVNNTPSPTPIITSPHK
jgi:hypothetical protein